MQEPVGVRMLIPRQNWFWRVSSYLLRFLGRVVLLLVKSLEVVITLVLFGYLISSLEEQKLVNLKLAGMFLLKYSQYVQITYTLTTLMKGSLMLNMYLKTLNMLLARVSQKARSILLTSYLKREGKDKDMMIMHPRVSIRYFLSSNYQMLITLSLSYSLIVKYNWRKIN